MKRLIVNVRDDTTDAAALAVVLRVVEGDRYCLCTVGTGGLVVYADKTRTGNDVFSVLKEASHR
jgi:hypothetical protein